jgi:rhamnosyl/mannosyltransferase
MGLVGVREELPCGRPAARRLRVCHLGKYYPPSAGGMETHVRTLARAQAALGADVRVVCVNDAPRRGLAARLVRRTPTVEEWDGPVRLTRVGRWASLARMDLCPGLVGVLRGLRREAPDVLHLHTPNPTMLLGLVALWPGAPLVVTHHSDVIKQRMLRYAVGPFERLVYGRAGRLLATSAAYVGGSAVLRRYPDKVQDLPLGLELAPYLEPSAAARQHAAKLRAKYTGPLWLAVGRLVYYKGLHVALEALPRVPGTLVVIGTGPLADALRRQAEQLGVAGRVVWQGHATDEEVAGAYHAATALWLPSCARSEGFGLVQVEAMASGCPVLNTALPHSGVAWVSRDGESGLTVPVADPEALAAAARRLLAEPGLRERLAAGGRQRARAEFGHEVMARRSLEVYREVLESGPDSLAVAAAVG